MDGDILAKQLGDLGRQLEGETKELARLDILATGASIIAAKLKEEYEDALALAFMDAAGGVEARKMIARLECKPQRVKAQEAAADAERDKAAVRNQQAIVRAVNSRIDIGRSLLSREKSLAALS